MAVSKSFHTTRGFALTGASMNSIANIDPANHATAKQLYAVGKHFATLSGSSPSEIWMLSKAFPAIMMRWNAEHSETPITHGDVQKFFELQKVPTKFSKMLTVNKKPAQKPKASKAPAKTPAKPKATPKPKAQTQAKPKAAPKAQTPAKPKASEMPVGDFKDHFEKITGRVFRLEKGIEDHSKRLALLDSKIDIIMAYFETNAE